MKLRGIVLLFLILSSLPCFGQTFMIVAIENRDGEELARPFASQEGMIEELFDLGFVSFDTGLYAPEVDWEALEFREPLAIARQGLARYLLAAEVRSITEPRDLSSVQRDAGQRPVQGLLRIETTVRYYLFDVANRAPFDTGEFVLDNNNPETLELTYTEFLYSVGRDIAGRGVGLIKKTTEKP